MSNVIDILVAVDAQSINANYRLNPSEVIGMGDSTPFVHMFTNKSYVRSEQGNSNLDVLAKKGDSIRWHVTTLSK
ncbi:inclusion body family protein [Xenorhabdus bovienii]|uniref:AidA/PixA family protein n=1 Tax=Xenorhabdus bovienii TaxID=40576 RepID=UPI0023B34BF2|nr:AidA/PixA family protein [Xenorhabdus bovienii]MDE9435650.1 inclusion body family protein [Xenorhabdus bovienii]MDE9497626.1 inclusion body family protein [Xenorhabdus bovienii]